MLLSKCAFGDLAFRNCETTFWDGLASFLNVPLFLAFLLMLAYFVLLPATLVWRFLMIWD